MHVRTPCRPEGIHAADAANKVLPSKGDVLAERSILPEESLGDWPRAGSLAKPRRQLRCTHAFDQNLRIWPWNSLEPLQEKSLGGQQPIAQGSVGRSDGCVRLAVPDDRANKKASPRVPPGNGMRVPGIHGMRNPFLLAVIARVLAGRVSHHPQLFDALGFVGKRAVLAGAVAVHEHLDGKFDVLLLSLQ